MKVYQFIIASTIFVLTLLSMPVSAGFDFCSEEGGSKSGDGGGSGSFQQEIVYQDVVEVGVLPSGIAGIEINLKSSVDVDIQLYDKATGEALVRWPDGVLSRNKYQTFIYKGMRIEWSGYAGDGTGKGNEFIRVFNAEDPYVVTDRAFVMKIYGYRAGYAEVNYSWLGADVEGCTISESGSGTFEQEILNNAVVTVGDIPTGVKKFKVYLNSNVDVDIQLYDKDGTVLVGWPDGLLKGSGDKGRTDEVLQYKGMTIRWSGYNGDGTGLGNEHITVDGYTTRDMTMKVYGFRSGSASVKYSWGQ